MNYAQDNPYLYKEFREWKKKKKKKQKIQFPWMFAYTPCNLGAHYSKINLSATLKIHEKLKDGKEGSTNLEFSLKHGKP